MKNTSKVKSKGTPSRKDEMVTGSTYPSMPQKNAPGVNGDIMKMGKDTGTIYESKGGAGSAMGNGKLPTFEHGVYNKS